MKKFFLMACMALAVVTNAVADRYIYSKSDLESFRNDVNDGNTYEGQTVYLTVDIDLGGASWTPIANTTNVDDNGFRGTFDGKGHKISNFTSSITINATEKYPMAGLFGLNKGTIKNLHVSNAIVEAKATSLKLNSSFAGAIAGCNRGGTIKNCNVYGGRVFSSEEYRVDGGYAHSGGIAGANYNGVIENCYVHENVSIEASKKGLADAYTNRISNKYKGKNSNTQTNCCTSTSDYNSSWRGARVNAAAAYVNNFGGAVAEPYYWDANGITPYIPFAFCVDAAYARAAASYETVVADTYSYNGATYNLYPAGYVIDVTAYPHGLAMDNADLGYKLTNINGATINDYVEDYGHNANGRYHRSQTAQVTLPTSYPTNATVLSMEHTGFYGVSMGKPAENVSDVLIADFNKSAARLINGAYFYSVGTQISVTVYPLGMKVNGEDDGYLLHNADALGAVRTDLTTVEGDRYVRQFDFNYVVTNEKNTITYETEKSGLYRLTLADHGIDPGVRYDAVVLTEPTMVTSPIGTEFPMYRDGQEVTIEFYLEGCTGSWNDTGYFVDRVYNTNDGVEIEKNFVAIYGEDGMDKDGNPTYNANTDRFMRTEVYEIIMPANVTTLAYTTTKIMPSSVENATKNVMKVYGTNGALVAQAASATELVVVSIDGRVVYNDVVAGNARIELPAGIYIANNNKVVVR